MKKRCPNCRLVNFPNTDECARCRFDLIEVSTTGAGEPSLKSTILKRAIVCLAVCVATVFVFYLSMVFTSAPLDTNQKATVARSIRILEEKGFAREVFLLEHLTAFRSNDNWLNASTRLENAYAATNFPFEIMTVYPEFFSQTTDDTERAAILLHEAAHLKGGDEKDAYEFVWRNRKKLGWTAESYAHSPVWRNVRRQTRENAPNLFVCETAEFGDCTQ